jgi:streptogramin lyase
VAFTADGDILVADTGNRRVQLFSDGGAFIRAVPAAGSPSPLRRPRRAAMDASGRILVADPAAGAVFVFTVEGRSFRALVPPGDVEFAPADVVVSRAGRVYVADEALRAILVFEGF